MCTDIWIGMCTDKPQVRSYIEIVRWQASVTEPIGAKSLWRGYGPLRLCRHEMTCVAVWLCGCGNVWPSKFDRL